MKNDIDGFPTIVVIGAASITPPTLQNSFIKSSKVGYKDFYKIIVFFFNTVLITSCNLSI